MEKAEEPKNAKVSASNQELDITQIQEESFDASQASTEDLNQTLQEEMALRKNLDTAFADAQAQTSFHAASSIQQKIAHFEQKLAANQTNATKPPPVPVRAAQLGGSKDQTSKQLKVFLRIRPCADSMDSVVEVVPPEKKSEQLYPTKIRTNPADESSDSSKPASRAKEYEFTQVFGSASTQNEVYERTAAPLVNQLCTGNRIGHSALLFSYGITNAGKTYTVLGDVRKRKNTESWGIVPRCLTHVLQKVCNTDLNVYISYFEIYNENVFDLLPTIPKKNMPLFVGSKPLKIRERHGQTVIKGLTKHPVQSLEHGLEVVFKAKENRHTASNHLNRNSSRSHCICQITVTKEKLDPVAPTDDDSSVDTATMLSSRPEESSTLWIVDLAGSERSKRTNNGSIRQKEASFINKSLMTLMGCLTRGEKNYRDSKLTVLFMHHWMKSGATSMIVNIHPSRDDYEETQHVLAYAISTKTIPNPVRKNEMVVPSTNVARGAEYGYDGRKRTHVQNDNSNCPDEKKNGEMKGEKKRKHKAPSENEPKIERVKRPPAALPSDFAAKAKKQKTEEPDVASVIELQKELSLARAENVELKQKLEVMEASVRDEVAEEMLDEMTSMTKRYDDTIRDLRAKIAALMNDNTKQDKLDRAQLKIGELMEQIKECEEEMTRMSETYADEKRVASDSLAEKDMEISRLQTALEESEREVVKLRKSKEELIKNYERLLSDEAGEEGEEDDGAVDPAEAGHKSPVKKKLQKRSQHFSSEPRPRQPLGIKTNMATPSGKTVAAKIAMTQPKPWRLIAEKNENALNRATAETEKDSQQKQSSKPRDESKFLYPPKPAKKDPSTGDFLRPRGRPPSGVAEWDEKVGAWSLIQQ
ncbi:hypothetical protein ACA910_021595 [Epithemia clementina (nom. ined.)]